MLRTNLPPNVTIHSMIFANRKFWIVGSHGLIANSSDGVDWRIKQINTSHGLNAIVYLDAP